MTVVTVAVAHVCTTLRMYLEANGGHFTIHFATFTLKHQSKNGLYLQNCRNFGKAQFWHRSCRIDGELQRQRFALMPITVMESVHSLLTSCGHRSLLHAAVCQLSIVGLIWRLAFVLGKFRLSDIEFIPLLLTFVIGFLIFARLNFVNFFKICFFDTETWLL